MQVIAREEVWAVAPDGTEFVLVLSVESPKHVDEEEWSCAVHLDGLHQHLRPIHGVTSWQALQLAIRLAHDLVADFISKGGRIYFEPGGEPHEFKLLFPLSPSN